MAEQRLIDANALKEHFAYITNQRFKATVDNSNDWAMFSEKEIEDIIDNAPTASPKFLYEIPVAKIEFSKEQMQDIVQQAIKKFIDGCTVETRACADCKYYKTDPDEEPCRCCCYGDGLDNWEAKDE